MLIRITICYIICFVFGFPAAITSRADDSTLLNPENQKAVLLLAREAFDSYAQDRTVISPPQSLSPLFAERHAVFVSTMRNGAPRTCMGTLYPCQPNFAEELIQNAIASAGRDRRFLPVKPSELKSLNLIVSVIIDTPRPISNQDAANLNPATDGLAVLSGDRYGVVLSGETDTAIKMIKWGRIRAGAAPNSLVRYYEIHDIRFMESDFK